MYAETACSAHLQSIPFSYFYERSPVPVGEYYGDRKRRALNDAYRPYTISFDNSVAVSAAENPGLVVYFASPVDVVRVALYYIVKAEWAKFAIKSFTLEASSDGIHYHSRQTHRTTHTTLALDDRYSTEKTLLPLYNIRYIRFVSIEAVAQNACLTEVEFEGTVHAQSTETAGQRTKREIPQNSASSNGKTPFSDGIFERMAGR